MSPDNIFEKNGQAFLCFNCIKSCKQHGLSEIVLCPNRREIHDINNQEVEVYGSNPHNWNRQLRLIFKYLEKLNGKNAGCSKMVFS